MIYDAVFLDFGGTLAYREPDEWDIFLAVCRENNLILTLDQVNRGRALADQTHRSEQFETRERMEFFYLEWFRLILTSLGVDRAGPLSIEIHSRFTEESKILLFPEVRDVLRQLTETGVVLGVVSNYNCNLEETCARLGISHYFEFILASDLVRSHKPDPGIFRLAVSEANASGDGCVHVGDSYGADYVGASKAGLQAILLDRSGEEMWACPVIEDLRDLIPMVGCR